MRDHIVRQTISKEAGFNPTGYDAYAAKTARQKRIWRLVAWGVAAAVVIIIAVVVAVLVTGKKNASSSQQSYAVSPYSNLTRVVTNNSTEMQSKERIFVIGDVHGCVNELNSLVQQIQYNPAKDQLILVGDLVSKGPDSIGVIRRAQQLGALCVRGNHDDKVVRIKTFERERGRNAMYPLSGTMPEGNVADPLKFDNQHVPIALAMNDSDYNYLASCPMILHLPFLNDSVLVHGGLNPSVSLENQVPYLVMNMRDIDNGQPTAAKTIGQQWGIQWNDAQRNRTTPTNVYYGHDAGRGLNLQEHTFGVDSGCVYGKQLSALEIRTHALTQVNCPQYTQ